jgi:DNA-directed RNA polymerase subunit beta
MPNVASGALRQRVDFSKIKTSIPIPNLIEVQKRSYERFLQMELLPKEREDAGLQSVFSSVFPISDFRGLSQLEFVDYSIGNWECKCGNLKGLHHLRTICRNPNCGAEIRTDPFHAGDVLCHKCGTFNKNIVTFCNRCGDPVALQLKYDVPECEERGMTYAAPLKVTIRLTVYDKDAETGAKTVRDIKEQEVFFGEIPLMTENGTFIINGTERVIVSQLHRSPGVFFERVQTQGYFLGKIIPYRGSWVEFEYDNKNLLYVRIDRKRKFYGTVFLRALGLKTDSDIIRAFYKLSTITLKNAKIMWGVNESLIGMKLSHAISAKSEQIVPQGRKITNSVYREIQKAKIEQVEVASNDLEGAYVAADVIDMSTGEVLIEANHELTSTTLGKLAESGISSFEIFFPERDEAGNVISATLRKDAVKTQNDALLEIYRKLRPGDPPTLDTATQLFQGMFFDARKYDFSRVGRMKFNIKLYDKADAAPLDKRTLDQKDFIDTILYLLKLRRGIGAVDDIDHLGNRRVRAVGELLENQFRIGLVRMERAIKEKMSVYQEMSTAMPHDLVHGSNQSALRDHPQAASLGAWTRRFIA